MRIIKTINALTKKLNDTPVKEFGMVLKEVQLDMDLLRSHMTWEKGSYTRNCLSESDKYEIILLCWDINAETPVHDHGGEDCWVYQLQGTLTETRYKQYDSSKLLQPVHEMELTPGKITYMHDRMGYHSIVNRSKEKALSLHVYASPIQTCNIYNKEQLIFESKELSYDSYNRVASIIETN